MDEPDEFAKLIAREVATELANGYAAGRYVPPPEYLNTTHAAAFLGLTPAGMETMRKEGRGPAFTRASSKLVRYRVSDLRDWMAQHRVEPGEGLG
ncbi:MAG: helix-turn-helix domain-containing protein [Rhodobacteraceae bacterium]|jgi:hypothetical protein|nr:helix-turn-helix domain-containing protein [Paracoccaceae bacterium]MBL4558233.1 helix-turn-helix domain-containing protein [Paracoccaceae bacterium]